MVFLDNSLASSILWPVDFVTLFTNIIINYHALCDLHLFHDFYCYKYYLATPSFTPPSGIPHRKWKTSSPWSRWSRWSRWPRWSNSSSVSFPLRTAFAGNPRTVPATWDWQCVKNVKYYFFYGKVFSACDTEVLIKGLYLSPIEKRCPVKPEQWTISANFSWKPLVLPHLTMQNHDDQSWLSFTNHDDDDHNNCSCLTWQCHPPLSNLRPRTFHRVPTALSQDAPEEDREFICQQQHTHIFNCSSQFSLYMLVLHLLQALLVKAELDLFELVTDGLSLHESSACHQCVGHLCNHHHHLRCVINDCQVNDWVIHIIQQS